MMQAGWDIGGAHLKLALTDDDGALVAVEQRACPLWQGVTRLHDALSELCLQYGPALRAARHIVTMTGELVDAFPGRAHGVRAILEAMTEHQLEPGDVLTARATLVGRAEACRQPHSIASANWLATASAVARTDGDAVLIDLGSTTCDLTLIVDGSASPLGHSDAERLASGELVYTGVVRTPVMALARVVPLAGRWHSLAAEYFASMADVYRLTGDLPEDADLLPTADGASRDTAGSARRLARMVGCDADEWPAATWPLLARYLAGLQLRQLADALACQLSRVPGRSPVIIGAGCGRFVAQRLAASAGLAYCTFADRLALAPEWRERASDCAPAVALALWPVQAMSRQLGVDA